MLLTPLLVPAEGREWRVFENSLRASGQGLGVDVLGRSGAPGLTITREKEMACIAHH